LSDGITFLKDRASGGVPDQGDARPGEKRDGEERTGRSVILAEDDPYMRTMLCGALEREGFRVTSVTDGLELVEAVKSSVDRSESPHLIVSDVQMPGCTGLTALARLRKLNLRTPALLITAFGDEMTHDQAKSLGASILDKPFDIYQFRTLVLELVRG
jgi:CheY-like chemotaxis protein